MSPRPGRAGGCNQMPEPPVLKEPCSQVRLPCGPSQLPGTWRCLFSWPFPGRDVTRFRAQALRLGHSCSPGPGQSSCSIEAGAWQIFVLNELKSTLCPEQLSDLRRLKQLLCPRVRKILVLCPDHVTRPQRDSAKKPDTTCHGHCRAALHNHQVFID